MTKDGKDPLLPEAENTADLIEPPTEEETNQAITGNLSNILVLVIRSLHYAGRSANIFIDEGSQKV